MSRLEITITRDGNAILGNYYRVSAWRGSDYLGERIYAGYTRRESNRLAREVLKAKGRFN